METKQQEQSDIGQLFASVRELHQEFQNRHGSIAALSGACKREQRRYKQLATWHAILMDIEKSIASGKIADRVAFRVTRSYRAVSFRKNVANYLSAYQPQS